METIQCLPNSYRIIQFVMRLMHFFWFLNIKCECKSQSKQTKKTKMMKIGSKNNEKNQIILNKRSQWKQNSQLTQNQKATKEDNKGSNNERNPN